MREYRLRRKSDPIKYQIYLERERIRNKNRKRYQSSKKKSSPISLDEMVKLNDQLSNACTEERRKVLLENGVELSVVFKNENIENPKSESESESDCILPQKKNRRKSPQPPKLPNYSLDDLFNDLEKIATKSTTQSRKSTNSRNNNLTSCMEISKQGTAHLLNNQPMEPEMPETMLSNRRNKRKRVPISDAVEIVPITIEELITPRRKTTKKSVSPKTKTQRQCRPSTSYNRKQQSQISITAINSFTSHSEDKKEVELVDLTSDVSDEDDESTKTQPKMMSTEMTKKSSNKGKPNFLDSFLGFVSANTS